MHTTNFGHVLFQYFSLFLIIFLSGKCLYDRSTILLSEIIFLSCTEISDKTYKSFQHKQHYILNYFQDHILYGRLFTIQGQMFSFKFLIGIPDTSYQFCLTSSCKLIVDDCEDCYLECVLWERRRKNSHFPFLIKIMNLTNLFYSYYCVQTIDLYLGYSSKIKEHRNMKHIVLGKFFNRQKSLQ